MSAFDSDQFGAQAFAGQLVYRLVDRREACGKHIQAYVKLLERRAIEVADPQHERPRRIVQAAGNARVSNGREEASVHRRIAPIKNFSELTAK